MKQTLTDQAIKRLRPPAKGRADHWDALVPGLSLRVTAGGAKSWTVVGRLHGRVVRVTLGGYPALPLVQARGEARDALAALQGGKHPKAGGSLSCEAAWNLYLASRAQHSEDHKKALRWAWKLYLKPLLGHLPLAEVKRGLVAPALDELARTKKNTAVKAHSYLRTFIGWTIERGYLEADPLAGLKPPAELQSRDRVYSDPELQAIWQASQRVHQGLLVRLLLATAQRRSQVWEMDWGQIDAARWIWTTPTKAGRLHPLPLSSLAQELLGTPQAEGRICRARCNWGRLKDGLLKQPGVPPDFRLHDLRRTAATRMAELGVLPRVIDAVLDHAQGGVSGVYQRYGYVEEMRIALERWAARLRAIVA